MDMKGLALAGVALVLCLSLVGCSEADQAEPGRNDITQDGIAPGDAAQDAQDDAAQGDATQGATPDPEAATAAAKARSEAQRYFPDPETVEFPATASEPQKRDSQYFETGTVWYKNEVGDRVRGEYRLWYDLDGNLLDLELDGETLR